MVGKEGVIQGPMETGGEEVGEMGAGEDHLVGLLHQDQEEEEHR